uniref:EF-hand domain-containing protein n=1 Tax=Alexandrium catenella TaxID=2925 RepID=A0A7S1MQ97_ALECA
MKGIRIEAWEARGLFQLLDTDALGQVSIEDFLHGLVRLKSKDQGVDLTTVMYENKRILTRLLAFMRFAEDHFRDMETYLGMTSPGGSGRDANALETYLQDAATSLSKSLPVCSGKLSNEVERLGRASEEVQPYTQAQL